MLRGGIGALSEAAGRDPFPALKDETFPPIGEISQEAAGISLTLGKMTYSAGNGAMSTIHEHDAGKRRLAMQLPYGAQTIQEQGRNNLTRAILKTTIRPFATRADSIYFSSPILDPQAAVGGIKKMPLDGHPGHFKPIPEVCGFPIEAWPGARRPGGPRMTDLDELKALGEARHG